jgi:hydroxyacylglutathione hydrolase
LPGTLAEEREINPFLRWDQPDVVAAAERRAGRSLTDAGEIFAVLREWKDAS